MRFGTIFGVVCLSVLSFATHKCVVYATDREKSLAGITVKVGETTCTSVASVGTPTQTGNVLHASIVLSCVGSGGSACVFEVTQVIYHLVNGSWVVADYSSYPQSVSCGMFIDQTPQMTINPTLPPGVYKYEVDITDIYGDPLASEALNFNIYPPH